MHSKRSAAGSKRVLGSELKCFIGFLNTLKYWSEEIPNYFVKRENISSVEGFNNKLKVLKRPCYGLFNRSTFLSAFTLTWKASACILNNLHICLLPGNSQSAKYSCLPSAQKRI